jgi:hypothetical protein
MESAFIGMTREECLKFFAENYRLMAKTLFALKLYIKGGIVKKFGEH